MRVKISALPIVTIIGRHHGKRKLLRQLDELRVNLFLFGKFVVLNLDIVAIAENSCVGFRGGLGLVVKAIVERLGDFTLQTGTKRDQAAVEFLKQLFVDTRLVVKT